MPNTDWSWNRIEKVGFMYNRGRPILHTVFWKNLFTFNKLYVDIGSIFIVSLIIISRISGGRVQEPPKSLWCSLSSNVGISLSSEGVFCSWTPVVSPMLAEELSAAINSELSWSWLFCGWISSSAILGDDISPWSWSPTELAGAAKWLVQVREMRQKLNNAAIALC